MTGRYLPQLLAAIVCWAALGAQQARAQYSRPATNPYSRPPISPYLNLLRGGNPAVNYYGVVRPEQQFYSSFQQLSQQVAANQMQLGQVEGQDMQPFTGHPSSFMNLSHYYGGGGQHAQGRGPGASAPTSRPGGTGGSTGASAPRR